MSRKLFPLAVAVAGAAALFIPAANQAATGEPAASHGKVERITVHGKSLEGNLEGDSPDRAVAVYLPPSYAASGRRRYPVVYMLHGYTDSEERWMGFIKHFINLPESIDKSLIAGAAGGAPGAAKEMIVVMPNAFTAFAGSMYSNSVTTGNWEDFVAHDLVEYIDAHYRTIAALPSRGLAGHSMGGYGTLRIGMKHPEVFSSIYALSPCCLTPNMSAPQGPNGALAKAEAITTKEDFDKADFGTKAQIASAAAWSPNPKKPPFFFDLPTKGGVFQPDVAARWVANSPLAMVDEYMSNLKRLHAIAFDAGDKDTGIAASIRVLDQRLNENDVPHFFEIYEGTHTSNVPLRIETKTMQFFSKNLAFDQKGR